MEMRERRQRQRLAALTAANAQEPRCDRCGSIIRNGVCQNYGCDVEMFHRGRNKQL